MRSISHTPVSISCVLSHNMTSKVVLVAFVVACLQPAFSGVPVIKKCKIEDAKCIKASAQAILPEFARGIPELGIEPLDPLKIKHLDASTSALKLKLEDAVVKGLSKCIIKKTQFSDDKKKLIVKILCTVEAKAKYEMFGSLLLLRMEGNGDVFVALNKILITVEAEMKEVTGADGKPHWSIPSWKHVYELKDKATVKFENLFNGNEVLGRAATEVISENSNDLVVELGGPIVHTVASQIVKCVNKLFTHHSKDSLIE